MEISKDYLNLADVEEITKYLETGDHIVFSCLVSKQNRLGMWQKRNLLLTTRKLYNVYGAEFKRGIDIAKVKALTKNIQNGNTKDFIVHVDGEYDYRFSCPEREEVFQCVTWRYSLLTN